MWPGSAGTAGGVQREWLKDRARVLRVYCVIETTALHTVPVCYYKDMFFKLEW